MSVGSFGAEVEMTGEDAATPERFTEGFVPSSDQRAEAYMGRRPENVLPFDQSCELGYWCPICKVPPIVDGEFDERLHWSEYNGFLWCSECNLDLPSALCVPLEGEPDPERPWAKVGPAAAVKVFLDTVDQALTLAIEQGAPMARREVEASSESGRTDASVQGRSGGFA